jgi:hypothetical protein
MRYKNQFQPALRVGSKVILTDYNNNIDRVLTNNSGTGLTKFRLEYHSPYVAKSYHNLRSWPRVAVTPGIEELDLTLSANDATFKFPCCLTDVRNRFGIFAMPTAPYVPNMTLV